MSGERTRGARYHVDMTDATTPYLDVRLIDGPVAWEPIDPAPVHAGGESVFLGRTRLETHPAHGPLKLLRYEVHPTMAPRILTDLAQLAIERFDCRAVRILHAIGDVPPGAASVLIQVACPHRSESFEACRFLIDELKASAPIWKCELSADGTSWSERTVVSVDNAGHNSGRT